MSATATAIRAKSCRTCGGPLPNKPATGRPPTFCPSRAGEKPSSRSDGWSDGLGKLEDLESDARVAYALTSTDYKAEVVAALGAEREFLEARLRELLT